MQPKMTQSQPLALATIASASALEAGLTTPYPAEAAMKESMMKAARRTVVLVDHTKVGNDYLARFAALSEVSVLITDAGLDAGLAADLAAEGPEVVRV